LIGIGGIGAVVEAAPNALMEYMYLLD